MKDLVSNLNASDLARDAFDLVAEVIVGVIFIFIYLYKFYFKNDLYLLFQSLLTFKYNLLILILVLMVSFITGNLLISTYNFSDRLLFQVETILKKRKVLWSHIIFKREILFGKSKEFSEEYSNHLITILSKYFELKPPIGNELFRLCRELTVKHHNLFKIHMLLFRDNIYKGIFMNIIIMLLYIHNNMIFDFGSLYVLLLLQRNIYANKRTFMVSVIDNAYLKVILFNKK